jgi:hypothetical protein
MNEASHSTVAKKKLKLGKNCVFLSDNSDSDSSVGSFFLKRTTEMRKNRNNTLSVPVKTVPTTKQVITPDLTNVHSKSSANRHQDSLNGVGDITSLQGRLPKVIDLTGNSGKLELPGPLLADMKEQNNVFWTYDPRGCSTSNLDGAYYCPDCSCPYHYCTQITFGDVVTTQVEFLLKEKNDPTKLTYDWLKKQFRGIYWTCVHHKMMINSIAFPKGYTFPLTGVLPACIELSHLNKLYRKYGAVCSENRDRND